MDIKCQFASAQVGTRQVAAAEEGDKGGGRRLTRQASLLQSPNDEVDECRSVAMSHHLLFVLLFQSGPPRSVPLISQVT